MKYSKPKVFDVKIVNPDKSLVAHYIFQALQKTDNNLGANIRGQMVDETFVIMPKSFQALFPKCPIR